MLTASEQQHSRPAAAMYGRPIPSMFLYFSIALFTAALVTDIVYSRSANLTWQYFSIWLITGGLVIGGFTLLGGLIAALRRNPWPVVPSVLYAAGWITEFVNAFVHSRDGWTAVVPQGLVLSAIAVVLIFASVITAAMRHREARA